VKIRLNPVILGVFIVGAVALTVACFLTLSSTTIFQRTSHFVIYLSDSAQGVSSGTSVSLQGVRIGQVAQVNILYEPKTKKSLVKVICEISQNLLTDPEGKEIDLTDARTIRRLISEGLFAQVQTSGIVGAKLVELGFDSSGKPTTPQGLPPVAYPVVPTVPSTRAELTDDITSLMSQLRQTDFQGIAQHINEVLTSARLQLAELQTNKLTTHFSDAAASFSQFMSSRELHESVARVQAAAAGLQTLLTNINAQVEPVATNLNSTLVSANQTAQGVKELLALHGELGQQTQDLLRQLDQTAHAIEDLADFLERHPNALLTGRAPPGNSP
jgi:paraquat-inducible protein B